MIESIFLTIPGSPVPKGRARAFVRNGHIAHFTPEKTIRYENLVGILAQKAMNKQPLIQGPVSLKITAFMKIPSSWSHKKQLAATMGHILPATRPDLDNIIKSLKDGANGIIWKDDSQVVEITACKKYGDPRVEMEIKPLRQQN